MDKINTALVDFKVLPFDLMDHRLSNYSFFLIGKSGLNPPPFKNKSPNELRQFFSKNEIVSIGFIKNKNLSNFEKELEIIQQKIDLEKSHFAVLIQYEDPNFHKNQDSLPSEESFLISPNAFIQFYTKSISTGLCYHFMLKALDVNNGLEQVIAHQIGHPNPMSFETTLQSISTEVIMPHQGAKDDLEVALWYLKKQKTTPTKVSVCFDEAVSEHHFELADTHSDIQFFANFPSKVGPYPSRDVLSRATEEEVIVYHDSDDISTTDRITTLTNALKGKDWDAVGSHELRVNKIKKQIEAVRFPPHVTEEMRKQDRYCIFFPSTAIKKAAYLKSGGLSTVRKHSSDSQFYRRAYFFLNLKNVDEFLYIRVKRENSLTTAKGTTLGSPVRERLKNQWVNDFVKVQNRNISLNESTLVDEPNVTRVDLIPVKKEYRETILKWQELTRFLQNKNPFKDLKSIDFPDEKNILVNRLQDYKLVKDPGVTILKQSFSWRIGRAITRTIELVFGWIPYVKKRL